MRLAEEGHSPEACFDFDLAFMQFDHWVEGRKNETKRVSAPPSPKRPTINVPRHETLADLLDLNSDEEIAANTPGFDEKADALALGDIDLSTFGVDPDPDDDYTLPDEEEDDESLSDDLMPE